MAATSMPDNEYNRALANGVHARMEADAAYITAMRRQAMGRTAMYWLAGSGAVLVGVAACVWAWGTYSDPRTSAEKMALAFSDALNRTTLKTAGEVSLASNALRLDTSDARIAVDTRGARLGLEPGRVTLDTAGARVSLDPNATINVAGGGGGFRPSARQLGEGSEPTSRAQVSTSFTVFKTAPYGAGTVTTGWKYNAGSSTDNPPDGQYCYYSQPVGDGTTDVKVDLAQNSQLITKPNRIGLNAADASRNCVWFGG